MISGLPQKNLATDFTECTNKTVYSVKSVARFFARTFKPSSEAVARASVPPYISQARITVS